MSGRLTRRCSGRASRAAERQTRWADFLVGNNHAIACLARG